MFELLFVLSHALVFPEQKDIYLEVVGQNKSTEHKIFFAPHENEHVSNNYVAQQVLVYGGKFLVLRQRGQRLIALKIAQQEVFIDPNRMFTDLGIKQSIKKLNPNLNLQSMIYKDAIKRAKLLGQFVITSLGGLNTKNTWVAVHNNTQGYTGDGKGGVGNVSIERYQKKLANGANYLIAVSQLRGDEDDLFFVTKKSDYAQITANQWNAVLQNPRVTTDIDEDDGSLSVYAQMHNIRYINIEAEVQQGNLGEDHFSKQKQMVDFTFSLISSSAKPSKKL
ncbi:MAG: hypothetical protein OCD00_13995 [Colwellia sp.]